MVVSIRPGACFACVVGNFSSLIISPKKSCTGGKLWQDSMSTYAKTEFILHICLGLIFIF